ncbi:hypothetical protein DIT71_09335 [Marinobacter vulgaris]|uniref:7-cyano-7-deazaguanine synthase n=1 Tax=Marinobacter vulgaris TaxID=1928331 RepID=A0A2V3ZJK5_9GAMM|nr:hypothetical protein [Marinobacter vulgaris]PXX90739.1 hypothetical protein DIT71_09335 [Marinobacter vulgaris]TSJ70287.1 hypothetical protein FPC41_11155 [Marinobacter vulgaris]
MPEITTLLWTGGWDSTFRLLQLLLVEKRSVQPIYVIDSTRSSTLRELESMDLISKMVRQRLSPGVTLYPKNIFLRSDFLDNHELKERFDFLKRQTRIGSQYYWLALIAENQKWDSVELSLERFQCPSVLQKLIFKDIEGERPTLNNSWEAELFKYWSFPLITTTKTQMKQIAKDHDFYDILLKRWFCFNPVKGKCCGTCKPCELAMEEGATEGVEFIHPTEMVVRKLGARTRNKLNRMFS